MLVARPRSVDGRSLNCKYCTCFTHIVFESHMAILKSIARSKKTWDVLIFLLVLSTFRLAFIAFLTQVTAIHTWYVYVYSDGIC